MKQKMTTTPHDWPEDAEDKDNGRYLHICRECQTNFVGHKRRPNLCKVCANKPPAMSPELKAACLSVGKLAGAHEGLRAVLMEGEPWPLRDVLAKLVEAGGLLLGFYDYRGDGWEEIHQAVERAKFTLANWPKSLANEPFPRPHSASSR